MSKSEYIKKKQKEYYSNKCKKDSIAIKTKNKVLSLNNKDEFSRIYDAAKLRIRKTLKGKNINIKFSYDMLLGCTRESFKNYIISIFKEDMNLENFGDWEMDHIIPIHKFNLTTIESCQECFNYKNIQLLWKDEHLTKTLHERNIKK
jgi:hypothetical protein